MGAADEGVVIGRLDIPPCRNTQRQEGLDLGGEDHATVDDGVEQRFDAEPVAHGDHQVPALVGDQYGELAAQRVDRTQAALQVEVKRDLAVAFGSKPRAATAELVADMAIAIELAVDRDVDVAGLVGHRLFAIAQADNGQPGMAEEKATVLRRPGSMTVGSTMVKRAERPTDCGRVYRLAHNPADQSAHALRPPAELTSSVIVDHTRRAWAVNTVGAVSGPTFGRISLKGAHAQSRPRAVQDHS